MSHEPVRKVNSIGFLGLALVLLPGFLSAQSPPLAREGINLGTFNPPPAQYSRSSLNAPATRQTGRPVGTPYEEYKEQYHWNDRDLENMSSTRWLVLTGRISGGWWYDDNINLSNGDKKVADSYWNLRPSFDLTLKPPGWGLTATITYDMDFQWYLDHKSDDAFNQHVGFNLNFDQGGGGRLRWYVNTS